MLHNLTELYPSNKQKQFQLITIHFSFKCKSGHKQNQTFVFVETPHGSHPLRIIPYINWWRMCFIIKTVHTYSILPSILSVRPTPASLGETCTSPTSIRTQSLINCSLIADSFECCDQLFSLAVIALTSESLLRYEYVADKNVRNNVNSSVSLTSTDFECLENYNRPTLRHCYYVVFFFLMYIKQTTEILFTKL